MTYGAFYISLIVISLLLFRNFKLRQHNTIMAIELLAINAEQQKCQAIDSINVNGPFLARPEVDVEIFDTDDETVGQGTTELSVKIHAKGVVLHGDVACLIPHHAIVAGCCLWIGGQRHKIHVVPRPCDDGSIICLAFSLPVDMHHDFSLPAATHPN